MVFVRLSSLDPQNEDAGAFIYPMDYQYKPNFSIEKTDCELELSPVLN